jgi:hypothetical protein
LDPQSIFGRLDQDVKDRILEIKEELRGNGGQRRNNGRNFQQGDRGGRTPYDQGDRGGRPPYDNRAQQGFKPKHNGPTVPKDSLEGTTTAIPKQYGATNARANMTQQNDDDNCDDRKRGVSDIGSDDTGPDEDPGSDSPLVFEAMKVFKTVQDLGNQLDTPRKARMANTVHFDAEDGNQADNESSTSTNFAKDTRDVQWRDPSDRLARYLTTLGMHISTLDDGADTCVVGDGWKILDTSDPQRYANLIGYDENSTRKRHVKITTADSWPSRTMTNESFSVSTKQSAIPEARRPCYRNSKCTKTELLLTPSPKLTKRTPMEILEHNQSQSMSIQLYHS